MSPADAPLRPASGGALWDALVVVDEGQLILVEPGAASRPVVPSDLGVQTLPRDDAVVGSAAGAVTDFAVGTVALHPCALRLVGSSLFGWSRRLSWIELYGIDLRHAGLLATDARRARGHLLDELGAMGVAPQLRSAMLAGSRRRLWDIGVLEAAPRHRRGPRARTADEAQSAGTVGSEPDDVVEQYPRRPRVWPADHESGALPAQSLGNVAAAVRASAAADLYDIMPLGRLDVGSVGRVGLRAGDVVFCSDYVWSVEGNLTLSRLLHRQAAGVIVVHGGPSVPKYREDIDEFLITHPEVDVAVVGEGERTAVELLGVLGGGSLADARSLLPSVAGIAFVEEDGSVVVTEARDRIASLESLPSPYLAGLYDHYSRDRFWHATVETNRGCPYGCTFCDWGSATMARVRSFPLDRVLAEITWVAQHKVTTLFIADANFGMFPRDVIIAEHIVRERTRTGFPLHLSVTFAKNASRHTPKIVDLLVGAGICTDGSIAVQTFEPEVLRLANRTNIRSERYDALLAQYRELGLPVTSDLLIGLPGATATSLRNDLQACFDRDLSPRLFPTMLLPNSPMNEPSFRRRQQIKVDAGGYVVATSSYDERDHAGFLRTARLFLAADHYGLLRYLLRHLQWEGGVAALDVLMAIDRAVSDDPRRTPHLAWIVDQFDEMMVQPGPWSDLADEFEAFAVERFDLVPDSAWAAVREVQQVVLPDRWATYPRHVELEHDYATYTRDRWQRSTRPLRSYGPGYLVVHDPTGLRTEAFQRNVVTDRSAIVDHPFWISRSWELESSVARNSKRFGDAGPPDA